MWSLEGRAASRMKPLYLLTLFAKGDKSNLTKAERNELAGLVDVLVNTWKRREKS
jgi:hypothetical protein